MIKDIINQFYENSVKNLNQAVLENQAEWYDTIKKLPDKERITYTVILFHTQVENGGLHQYFFNSFGQFAQTTVKSLISIGAIYRSEILIRALEEVNSENFNEEYFGKLIFDRKIEKIVNFDDDIFDILDALDNKYYNIEDEDIYALLESFLQN